MHENKIKFLLLSIIDSKIRGMNDCFLSLTGLQPGLALLQVRHWTIHDTHFTFSMSFEVLSHSLVLFYVF